MLMKAFFFIGSTEIRMMEEKLTPHTKISPENARYVLGEFFSHELIHAQIEPAPTMSKIERKKEFVIDPSLHNPFRDRTPGCFRRQEHHL